jgi:hypothetical protein
MTQEAISISSDGLSHTPETQIRNKLYEDDTGKLFGVLETDGRFFIHTQLYEPQKLSHIKHYKKILKGLEENLREHGLTKYYTMADSVSGFRFNELMGFKTNLEVWNDYLEVMVKEL